MTDLLTSMMESFEKLNAVPGTDTISPEAVRIGDKIRHVDDDGKARWVTVKKVNVCEGKWRTHLHINSGCYDTRVPVTVKR